jgi:uncharacterized protein
MANSYPRPGAYINETLTPLAQTGNNIPGEAVAAFAAAYNIGPVVPTFCTSFGQFTNLYGNFNVAGNGPAGAAMPLHYAVYTYFANGGTGCYVLRVPNTNATTASLALQDVGSATVFTATAAQGSSGQGIAQIQSPGAWGNSIYVEIVAVTSTGSAHVNLNVYYGGTSAGYLVETFLNVSTNPADPRYVLSIVNSPVSGSNYIQLSGGLTYVSGTTDFAPITPTALSGGGDGSSAPTLGTVVPSYFDQYCQMQILNMNLPGDVTGSDINAIVTWAAGREDVFVVADGPVPSFPETSAQCVSNYTNQLSGGSAIARSSFVCVFAPYLLIQDPASSSPGATRYVPPSGSILGMFAATDNLVGPQQMPAGTSYGQISCLDLEVRFSATDLNNLFPLNINAIKMVPGTGFCVFGARTLLQGYPSMFIPIRRTLMKIEHDCSELVQFAMFEPNTPSLWSNVTTVLTNYLNQQTQAGLLGTSDPSTAYTVICDSTNNTAASAQAGYLTITVAVALGSPVEIIIINISLLQTGATNITTTVASQ